MISLSRGFQIAALGAFGAATLAVAGCGGGSSTATPAVTATATPTPSGNGNGSSSTPTFTFTNAGGTANITAVTGGQTLTSGAAVGGVTVSSTWGANTATATIAMTAQVATGTGDVTPAASFPLFTVATAVDNNGVALTGAYTAIDYLKITATPVTNFSLTPGVVITGASVTGKTSCSLFSLGGTVAAPKWQQAVTATSLSPTITFTATALGGSNNTVTVGNDAGSSSAILALACK